MLRFELVKLPRSSTHSDNRSRSSSVHSTSISFRFVSFRALCIAYMWYSFTTSLAISFLTYAWTYLSFDSNAETLFSHQSWSQWTLIACNNQTVCWTNSRITRFTQNTTTTTITNQPTTTDTRKKDETNNKIAAKVAKRNAISSSKQLQMLRVRVRITNCCRTSLFNLLTHN